MPKHLCYEWYLIIGAEIKPYLHLSEKIPEDLPRCDQSANFLILPRQTQAKKRCSFDLLAAFHHKDGLPCVDTRLDDSSMHLNRRR